MYIIQNALENIRRNKGRNTMMGLIIFAIILTTVVALIINNTASTVIESYRERHSSQVTISPDMEKLREQISGGGEGGRVTMRMPEISTDISLALADSEFLKESVATGSLGANSDTIIALDQETEQDEQDNEQDEQEDEQDGPGRAPGGGMVSFFGGSSNFRLLGDSWQEFTDGSRQLADDGVSVMPQEANECLVSEALAEENGIAVGDELAFTANLSTALPDDMDTSGSQDGDVVEIDGREYTLTEGFNEQFTASRQATLTLKVSGIYVDLNDAYTNENMPQMAALNRWNEVLTTLEVLLSVKEENETGVSVSVTYYLKDPALLPEFETEARAKGLPDTYLVSTDTATYEQIVKPVVGLKSISLTFMLVVLVLGAVILLLLSSIAIRERKYEIGVLRAMGMKKSRVALGLWVEMLALCLVCLVFGLGIGTVAAQPVSDAILTSQAEASGEDTAGGMLGEFGGGGGGLRNGGRGMLITRGGSEAQPLTEMKISLNLLTIVQIIGIAILLSSVAALFAIGKITRYEPIKILMERN